MELYFECPSTGKGYFSASWQIVGELQVEENPQGTKTLKGMVKVECPCCGGMHAYSTEKLACPLAQAGK